MPEDEVVDAEATVGVTGCVGVKDEGVDEDVGVLRDRFHKGSFRPLELCWPYTLIHIDVFLNSL